MEDTSLTLIEFEQRFQEHYEDNLESFISPCTRERMAVLRSSVDMLNRLEGTTHYQLIGRILIFLAKALPLCDQSGLNQRSEFNVKEIPKTVSEILSQIGSQNADKEKRLSQLMDHDMEEGETLSDDDESNESSREPKDDSDSIYERFWKVQKFLNQPNLLYDKNNCFTFRTNVDVLISKMESIPANLKVWKLNKSFMSSQKALALQFNDMNMRRCFLVQLLIVVQYLELPVVDSKPESCVLDKVQLAWFSTITKRVYHLLESMPNQDEGRRFLGLIRHVLKREELWNKWKNDKCTKPKDLQKFAEEEEMVNMRGTYNKRRKISDELKSAKPYNMHVIGSQEMSKLWNMKQTEKFNPPDLDKYLNVPEEKQEELFQDPNYSFRVLRLLRRSPHFFEQTSATIVGIKDYLKIAASRHNIKPKT